MVLNLYIKNGTTRMHRNRNACNTFLMVEMASGMDHGRVRLATTSDNDDDDVAQHGGHLKKPYKMFWFYQLG